MNKQELMKQLLDLYEQRKFVNSTDESQHAIDEHIEDLEATLKELL